MSWTYTPEPEMPARFARQLLSLARGLALVGGRTETNDADLATVIRVGFDSIPDIRRTAMEHLAECDHTVNELAAKNPRYSPTSLRRVLEDLQTLSLVGCECRSSDGGEWTLAPETAALMVKLQRRPVVPGFEESPDGAANVVANLGLPNAGASDSEAHHVE